MSSPGGVSGNTDDGSVPDVIKRDGPFKKRTAGLFSKHNDEVAGKSFNDTLNDAADPRASVRGILHALTTWTDLKKGSDVVEYNPLSVPLAKTFTVALMEFMYTVESANEISQDKREYYEDDFMSKFCQCDDFAFLESIRDSQHMHAKSLLLYLKDQKLNQIRLEDSFSSNRFLKLRSEILHTFRVFEYGTLIYYVSELRDLKKAFDYTLWYFRNSTMGVHPEFTTILLGIVDGLVMFNFNEVMDAAREICPRLWDRDIEVENDPDDPLNQYFMSKKNQSIACVKRLILTNEKCRNIINPCTLDKVMKLLKEDSDCIQDVIDIYYSNNDKFNDDNNYVVSNLKKIIYNNWNDAWDSGVGAPLLENKTFISDSSLSAVSGGPGLRSTTNVTNLRGTKAEEWAGLFSECGVLDRLKRADETKSEWMSDVGSDPLHVMKSMQCAVNALYLNQDSSLRNVVEEVYKRELDYKERAKTNRARQNTNITQNQSIMASHVVSSRTNVGVNTQGLLGKRGSPDDTQNGGKKCKQ